MPKETKDDASLLECEKTLAAADKALKQLENEDTVNEKHAESSASDSNVLEAGIGLEDDDVDEYESIASMKQKIKEMEAEAKKIEEMQALAESRPAVPANGPEADMASVYVGNVDYSTRPEELQTFFSSCGAVQRVTIMTNKFTGQPKGYAYVQFRSAEAVANAVLINDSEFKGRRLKINEKRTNIPGYSSSRGYRGGYGRYRGYRGYRGRGYRSRYRGRGYRGYRGRGWNSWSPY